MSYASELVRQIRMLEPDDPNHPIVRRFGESVSDNMQTEGEPIKIDTLIADAIKDFEMHFPPYWIIDVAVRVMQDAAQRV